MNKKIFLACFFPAKSNNAIYIFLFRFNFIYNMTLKRATHLPIFKSFSFFTFLFYHHPSGFAFISSNIIAKFLFIGFTYIFPTPLLLTSWNFVSFKRWTISLCKWFVLYWHWVVDYFYTQQSEKTRHIFSHLKEHSPSFLRPRYYVIPTVYVFLCIP